MYSPIRLAIIQKIDNVLYHQASESDSYTENVTNTISSRNRLTSVFKILFDWNLPPITYSMNIPTEMWKDEHRGIIAPLFVILKN